MTTFLNLLENYSSPRIFNPYRDHCAIHDVSSAPERRKQNLLGYLGFFENKRPHLIWVGEALGHRGGKRTGLPFTDDVHIHEAGIRLGFVSAKPTIDILKETTAGVIWETALKLPDMPLFWNIFPFHPHGDALHGNRSPTAKEIHDGSIFLTQVLEHFEVDQVFAIGRIAERVLLKLGIDPIYLRHPSHGGISKFRQQVIHYLL